MSCSPSSARLHRFHGNGRRLLGRRDFPVAVFFQAGAHDAGLAPFLDDEGRAAFRAGLGERPVRRREIALRITVASVEDAHAALLRAAFQQLPGAALWTRNAQRLRADEFAFGIGRAAGEFAVAPVPADELRAAVRALFVQQLVRLTRHARAFDQAARRLALRIAFAREENAEAAALDDHLLAAVIAILDLGLSAGFLGEFRGEILDEIALGIARAAQKEAVAADAFQ